LRRALRALMSMSETLVPRGDATFCPDRRPRDEAHI
jgi:hypothetical protein